MILQNKSAARYIKFNLQKIFFLQNFLQFLVFCKNNNNKKIFDKIISQQYFGNFSQKRFGEQPLT